MIAPTLLIAGGAFLTGVLWMDLLFDTRILRLAPEIAVPMIVAYYDNATIQAYPLNRLIALVMVATVGGAIYQLLRGGVERWIAAPAVILSVIPVALALTRIVPNAMRLGTGVGSLEEQATLARAICFDHLLCLAMMCAFIAVQIGALRRLQTRPGSVISEP